MATFNKVNSFVLELAHGGHNLGSNQLTIFLTNSAPSAANTVIGDITQITYTNLSSRNITTGSSSQTSGTYKLVLNDIVLTASGGSVGPFRYVGIYNSTNNKLIGWYDYGSSITLADGETLTVDFDGTNGLLQLA